MTTFQKAVRRALKARMAIMGPAGSGKTYSALALAKGLGGRVAVIDTEHGSASKYEGYVAEFDVAELDTFSPDAYIAAIRAASAARYDVLIVDSLSHAWAGKDGILEQKDASAARDSFSAWRTLTPQHNRLVEALLSFDGHLIVTMRSKMAYDIDRDERGKSHVRKVGLAPVQREGLEYEFDVVGDMDDGVMTITKSRCPAIARQQIRHPGAAMAATLKAWLDDGMPQPARPAPDPVTPGVPKSSGAPTQRLSRGPSLDDVVDAHEASKAPPRAPARPPGQDVTPDGVVVDFSTMLGELEAASHISPGAVKAWYSKHLDTLDWLKAQGRKQDLGTLRSAYGHALRDAEERVAGPTRTGDAKSGSVPPAPATG